MKRKTITMIGAIYVAIAITVAAYGSLIEIGRAVIIEGPTHQLATQDKQSNGYTGRLSGSTRLSTVSEKEVSYPPNYLLIWSADWCPFCPRMKTIGDKLKNEGFDVFYIDLDTNQKQARKDKITSIPVAVVYATDKEVERFVGISQRTEARVEAQIRKILRKNKCH